MYVLCIEYAFIDKSHGVNDNNNQRQSLLYPSDR